MAKLRGAGTVSDQASFRRWAATAVPEMAFVGPDPHHALGLEELVPGYRVVAGPAPILDPIADAGVSVYRNEVDLRTAAALMASPGVADFISRAESPAVLVFKSSYELEAATRRKGWRLVAGSAGVARRWENKVFFMERARELGLPTPMAMGMETATSSFDTVAAVVGHDIVLQAPHGFGGARTMRVRSRADFGAAVAALKAPRLRAAAYVDGTPCTLTACVTGRGVAVGAPMLQLTGIPELTPRRLASCGNDGPSFDGVDIAPFRRAAVAVGAGLAADGFRGIFGLDFVLPYSGEPVVIEVNPRLVASVGLLAPLEVAAGRLPLFARHVLALVEPDADTAPLELHEQAMDGAQVILHNLASAEERIGGRAVMLAGAGEGSASAEGGEGAVGGQRGADLLECGVYVPAGDSGDLAFQRKAYKVTDLSPGELLIVPAPSGRDLGPGAEAARIQVRGTSVALDGGLTPSLRSAALWTYLKLGLPGPAAAEPAAVP